MAIALAAFAACDGRTNVGELGQDAGRPTLLSVEYGRLVDVFAYRRINGNEGDRRLRENRRLELVASDIVINPGIISQPMFDAAGNLSAAATYQFLPFDKGVGHEQLVILWDDTNDAEADAFNQALEEAQQGLVPLANSYRNQNTQTNPIPLVPRNCAFKLNFSSPVGLDADFFSTNPSALQLLEFNGDPDVVEPAQAFRILPYRAIASGSSIVLDTTILGGEAAASVSSAGLPLSPDNITANIRIAIPTRGSVFPSFFVRTDSVAELNGVDSAGRNAVIRDFRSGNLLDGLAGRLPDPEMPQIVATLDMFITDVDSTNNVLTLNKNNHRVPIRGRYPFVEGGLSPRNLSTGTYRLPGPPEGSGLVLPGNRTLRSGDIITQEIEVTLSDNVTTEVVRLRAEVLENLAIETSGDPAVFSNLGRTIDAPGAGSAQGEGLLTADVRVATVSPGRDSEGRLWSFQASGSPQGAECAVRVTYVEDVPFLSGPGSITDAGWREEFLRVEPSSGMQPNSDVSPMASVAIEFNKPMDLDQIDNTANFLLTNGKYNPVLSFDEQMGNPKRATTLVVPTRLTDLNGDGTVLRLQPPLGLAHANGTAEVYWFHIMLGNAGVTDLAGNPVLIYDNISNPLGAWSVSFSIDMNAQSNRIGWHTYRFEAEDEDGTRPGSPDLFGQFRLENGRLYAATGGRFSRSANGTQLATISRIVQGQCWDSGITDPAAAEPNPNENVLGYPGTINTRNQLIPPVANPPQAVPVGPLIINATPPIMVPTGGGQVHPGRLYWAPTMVDQVLPQNVPQVFEFYQQQAQSVGRVVEPLKPQGSRMQLRYLEDDFQLGYTQPSDFGLDVEQLYWSPFNEETVLYDEFDRFTMRLGHSRKRSDERWLLGIEPGPETPTDDVSWCVMDCSSMNSGLSTIFADNILQGTQLRTVFQDKFYAINPNNVVTDLDQVPFVPYPRFDNTYTWRDSRLITVDESGNVIGLGGAQNPDALANEDTTTDINSPWVESRPDPEFEIFGSGIWVQDPADFVGNVQRDHDPIALPLLVDIMIFPDDPSNGVAQARNSFQVGMLGVMSSFPPPALFPGGYYDTTPSGCGGNYQAWPRVRVHASGGFDAVSQGEFFVDPANVLNTTGNVVKDAGAVLLGSANGAETGLYPAPPGDGMLHWARADFVRKVSTATFGFFDTLRPQRSEIGSPPVPDGGFPDWSNNTTLRMSDVLVQLDPPQNRQPAGTSVVVELRCAETIDDSEELYDPLTNDIVPVPGSGEQGRFNLLNAKYACEAYRYSTPNINQTPRVLATDLTPYVTEDQIDSIRYPTTGLLPRFLNPRLIMTNNVNVEPALEPSLRSMSIIYRLSQ